MENLGMNLKKMELKQGHLYIVKTRMSSPNFILYSEEFDVIELTDKEKIKTNENLSKVDMPDIYLS